jgi:dTDP-4-amino-4,6-dideoxygalactose transaminase
METHNHYKTHFRNNNHLQKLYQGYECVGGQVAEDLNRRGICLPSSSCLTEDEQQFVIECIREAHQGKSGIRKSESGR